MIDFLLGAAQSTAAQAAPDVPVSLGVVTLYAVLAAAAAAPGALLARGLAPTDVRIGLADALAAGMMLGIAYPMMRAGLTDGAVAATAGGAVAVFLLLLLHLALGIDGPEPANAALALRGAVVHAIPEGVSLGVAAALDARLLLAVAGTLALHNVGEAMVLSSQQEHGAPRMRSAWQAVLSNTPQVVLAVATFAAATRMPRLQPVLLGASAGALVYLALADLLPGGYRAAGRTALSVVVIAASAMVTFAVAVP